MKNNLRISVVAFALIAGLPSSTPAGGAGNEWKILNQEVENLYAQRKYDRALILAEKALVVAEFNAGPEHLNVATCLENLALLCRATKRVPEAELLEKRAAKIRDN